MKSSLNLKPFYPAGIWSLAILWASYTLVGKNLPSTLFDLFETDKVGHLGIYAILSFLILTGFSKIRSVLSKSDIIIVLLWCAFYGFLMECLQYFFFPERYFEIPDIVANIIGSIAGLIFFLFWKNKIDKRF